MIQKTAAVYTLGCRLNQADSALISTRLERLGFKIIPMDASPAPSVIVINSCTVTGVASKKSLQALRSIRTENPQAYVIYTGCHAVTDKDMLEKRPEIDLLLSNEDKKNLETVLPRYLAYLETSARKKKTTEGKDVFLENANTTVEFKTRATLKIQDGCSNACSYCIVPRARGPQKSRQFQETLDDFRSLVEKGFHEIVLSGVNLCTYHCDGKNFADLLNAFLEIPGDWRIRIGSMEPGPVMPQVIDCMAKANGRICHFLHMPLQHGSDTILKAMNRHCYTKEYAAFVDLARQKMPDVHIGTDIIIGFPGETDNLFEESVGFLRKISFANIHAFPFSLRPGTAAEKLKNDVTKEQVAARVEVMKQLKAELAANYTKSMIGKEEEVLVELRRTPEHWEGWSGNYLKTIVRCKEDIGKKLIRVKFVKINPLNGELEAVPVSE